MTNGKLKVGDIVILSKRGKSLYQDDSYNPHDTLGKITGKGYVEGWVVVKWSNGAVNDYKPGQLKKIKV